MSWFGPSLSSDQRDVLEVVDQVLLDVDADDVARVRELPRALAGLGLWTLGVPEDLGGGGADWATTILVIERISRAVPELGVACAHAHAAAWALSDDGNDGLRTLLHAGEAEVVVVDSGSPHVSVVAADVRWTGRVDRFDAFTPERAHVVLLGDAAMLIQPAGITVGEVHRTTGLSSFRTVSLAIDGTSDRSVHLLSCDVAAVRAQLLGGVAAVATGIAGSAFDAACAYAGQRHQFGGPINALPVVRASLDRQFLSTAALARAVLGSTPDLHGSIAIARQGCDTALEVADAALQIHGGYGYLREYSAERSLRDAVSLRASFDLPSTAAIQQLQ